MKRFKKKKVKEKKKLLKSSTKIRLSNKNKTKFRLYIILNIILIIVILFLILYFLRLHKKKKLNDSEYKLRIYDAFQNNNNEINLFLKNKTEFYYQKRKNFLHNNYHRNYDESNLQTFQDKLNYLMIHESPEYKSDFADKIKVCEFTKKILGKDICVPILKIYNNVDEIKLNELPDKFILKCNHGSGMNIICKDKSSFNLDNAKSQFKIWINMNYGLHGAEFQYYFIKRKIFASVYLGDNIIDYKFYCFHGNPKYIVVKKESDKNRHQYIYNFYDLNWTLTDIEEGRNKYKRDPYIIIEKPKHLDLMIDYSKKLSKEFVFVRVDLYEVNDIVYLGELTFSPSNMENTFKNLEQNIRLGDMIDITKIKYSLFNN